MVNYNVKQKYCVLNVVHIRMQEVNALKNLQILGYAHFTPVTQQQAPILSILHICQIWPRTHTHTHTMHVCKKWAPLASIISNACITQNAHTHTQSTSDIYPQNKHQTFLQFCFYVLPQRLHLWVALHHSDDITDNH